MATACCASTFAAIIAWCTLRWRWPQGVSTTSSRVRLAGVHARNGLWRRTAQLILPGMGCADPGGSISLLALLAALLAETHGLPWSYDWLPAPAIGALGNLLHASLLRSTGKGAPAAAYLLAAQEALDQQLACLGIDMGVSQCAVAASPSRGIAPKAPPCPLLFPKLWHRQQRRSSRCMPFGRAASTSTSASCCSSSRRWLRWQPRTLRSVRSC